MNSVDKQFAKPCGAFCREGERTVHIKCTIFAAKFSPRKCRIRFWPIVETNCPIPFLELLPKIKIVKMCLCGSESKIYQKKTLSKLIKSRSQSVLREESFKVTRCSRPCCRKNDLPATNRERVSSRTPDRIARKEILSIEG